MSTFARRLQRVPAMPTPQDGGMRVAVYFPGYSRSTGTGGTTIANLNWNSFTHVIDFSMGLHGGHLSDQWLPDGSGSLNGNSWSGSQATALCSAAAAHGKKALLCIGSANTSESWNANLDTTGKRTQIASEVADCMTTYGYSGVDLDGEPGSAITNYRLFWQAIIAEFASRGWRTPGSPNYKTVTMACFGSETALAKNAVLDGMDWVAPMLYTPYENTSHHLSPLAGAGYPWDTYVDAMATGTNAIPRSKISPGMSYFAFSWSGATGPEQSGTLTSDRNWADVNTAIGGINAPNATWYPTAAMHGMGISGSWYSFETAQSIQAKADWLAAGNAGGTIIWMYQHGSLGGTNHPLANAVAASFGPLM